VSVELAPAPGLPRLGLPRVLIAAALHESSLYAFGAWSEAIAAQETELLWDVALLDNTDAPAPAYISGLRSWARAAPFGPRHRVRLLAREADTLTFRHPIYKVRYAERALWGKFAAWSSYDYLLSSKIDVLMPPDGLQKLYEATLPWAAATIGGASIPPSLGCTLLRGDLVRSVPFDLGDEYAGRAAAAGFPVIAVPAVRCARAEEVLEKEATWRPR
jgi:hypothetical protein